MKISKFIVLLLFSLMLTGCQLNVLSTGKINIEISVDNSSIPLEIEDGSTVQNAITAAGIALQPLDKVDPALSSILHADMKIKITRVVEEFQVEESILPFENQTVKNESLPNGQSVLIQAGVNGKTSSTYRVVKEDGVVASKTLVKTETLVEAKPEIVMIGVQSPFTSVPMDGILAYITSSNAWVMETTTGNRRPVVTTGDLDGRIFSISPDRKWLLFSRSISMDNSKKDINSLWIVNLEETNPSPVPLGVANVVHYAEWIPGQARSIAFSTVEPRDIAPGWQANNDLIFLTFDDKGKTIDQKIILETNAGGLYGWWGTTYAISPDGQKIAYARPDSIGFVDQENGSISVSLDLVPYQTNSDWAWVPGICWSPDSQSLYTVLHGSEDSAQNAEISSQFDLSVVVAPSNQTIRLVINSGLFSYPVPSAMDKDNHYLIAYLSAILPDQSETSRYNLQIMDRDGSNQKKLFPGEGIQGLNPQTLVWSPDSESEETPTLGFIVQGNIMLVSTSTGAITQLTGDGSVSKIDWR